jgi:hypothetical protein
VRLSVAAPTLASKRSSADGEAACSSDREPSKLSRGAFAATFFLATMKAIGRERIELEDV